eukprot:Pompholyxophrys_sp_v1_NODE_679_length_397_cov_29.757310.p1 type:complete len:111 gc:universal NODE_679_length_397_cov_29.757310:55-387(+)
MHVTNRLHQLSSKTLHLNERKRIISIVFHEVKDSWCNLLVTGERPPKSKYDFGRSIMTSAHDAAVIIIFEYGGAKIDEFDFSVAESVFQIHVLCIIAAKKNILRFEIRVN